MQMVTQKNPCKQHAGMQTTCWHAKGMEIDADNFEDVGSDAGAFRWGTMTRGMEDMEANR